MAESTLPGPRAPGGIAGRPMRVALARIAQETNALSPLPTTLDDFRRAHWVEGQHLLDACSPWAAEVPGYGRNLELSGMSSAIRRVGRGQVEPVPLLSAWAIPSGPLTAETFTFLRDRLLRALDEVGPLDGVLLALHGSMGATGFPEPEVALLEAVRDLVGPRVRLGLTLDLHAHVNARLLAPVDVLAGYRTNPHRDHFGTGFRAGAALVRTLRGEATPTLGWRSLPVAMGGGTTLDLRQPMRPIFRRLREIERDPEVLCASLFLCHLWSDAPEPAWAPVVYTNGRPDLAEAYADELARAAWAVRDVPPPHFPTADEAVDVVRRSRLARLTGTICLSDASDVVGAGAPGENTGILRAMLEHGRGLRVYVPLRDPVAVARAWELGQGARFAMEVGGRLDPRTSPPVAVSGRVRRVAQTRGFGRAAVLDLGHVKLVVTEAPPLVARPAFYQSLGLPIMLADAVVVKSLFPFRLFFAAQNRKTIYVRTRGVTDLDAGLARASDVPVHPRDPVDDWRSADRIRRGSTLR